MMLTLEVTQRDQKLSPEEIRAQGSVPAVFYGPKEAAQPIAINARVLESVWKEAGETTIITLKGIGEAKDTLIKDVQVHPVTGKVLHADFYVIEKGKKITLNIPLEFIGDAPAEKLGHVVVKALHEVEIEVSPAELPHSLEVDISKLENVGDHVTVADIKLPQSGTMKTHGEEIVASVTAVVEEKEEAPAAPAEGEAAAVAGGTAPAPEGEAKTE